MKPKLKLVKKFVRVALLTWLATQPLFAQTNDTPKAKEPETIEALQQRLGEIVNNPRYKAGLFGVKIVSLDSGKVWFEHDADKLCSPASNSKLYTMAMALERLGPDYRTKTSLYASSKPDAEGVLKGDLIVYGRGDPTISGEYNQGNVWKALDPFVAILTNAGVKRIDGDIVGDDSYFRSPPYGSGWDWGDLDEYYGAEISALTINSNTMQLVVKPGDTIGAPAKLTFDPLSDYVVADNRVVTSAKGTEPQINVRRDLAENIVHISGQIPLESKGTSEDVTMHNPVGWFATLFKAALAEHGVAVTGQARSVNYREREVKPLDMTEWKEIGAVPSHPLREVIRSVQKPSQNLYTDMMLEQVGARHFGERGEGRRGNAEQLGIRELNNFLGEIGIGRGETIFEEGSGLSRDNLTTPSATVKLLTYMSKQKDADVYINALPLAGVDGTLRHRFRDTPAANNLRAKTGTLRWANSLSGYVKTAAGERLAFSMMLNRYSPGNGQVSKTHDMDVIGELLARFNVRSDAAAK